MVHEFEYMVREILRDKNIDEYGKGKVVISQEAFSEILTEMAVRMDMEIEQINARLNDIKLYIENNFVSIHDENLSHSSGSCLYGNALDMVEILRELFVSSIILNATNTVRFGWEMFRIYQVIKYNMAVDKQLIFMDKLKELLERSGEEIHNILCKLDEETEYERATNILFDLSGVIQPDTSDLMEAIVEEIERLKKLQKKYPNIGKTKTTKHPSKQQKK